LVFVYSVVPLMFDRVYAPSFHMLLIVCDISMWCKTSHERVPEDFCLYKCVKITGRCVNVLDATDFCQRRLFAR
jgi:hypothetical protein